MVRAIQRAKNSVVNIHSEKTARHSDTLFSVGRNRKVSGMGTGIVIDERGYIVTNFHVVDGVDSLRLTSDDGSTYTAQVITFDKKRDLAIIKVEPSTPMSVMPLGTSSDLMLGETVIAVGNAYGYEHTVTAGIISALSRDVEVNETQSYENLIQTDASINPGNSGGPLLNLDGEVVGINVAIRAGAQRIGFAIPIDDARKAIAQLLSVKPSDGAFHGIVSRDVKFGSERRVVVDSIQPNSPAEKSGMRAGDVIVKANSLTVVDGVDLARACLGRRPGESIEVVVSRNGKNESLDIQLETRRRSNSNKAHFPIARSDAPETLSDKAWNLLGLRLTKISKSERHLVQPRYRGGMRVVQIRKNSPASQSGIQAGDILVGLHEWETVNAGYVAWILNHRQLSTFSPLKFHIMREQQTRYGHLAIGSAADAPTRR